MKGEYMEQQILSCCSLVADGVFKLSGEKRQQVSHEILISILLDIYQEVELLDDTIVLLLIF